MQAKATDAARMAREKVSGQLQGLSSAKSKVPGLRHKDPDAAANGHRPPAPRTERPARTEHAGHAQSGAGPALAPPWPSPVRPG